MVVIGSEGMLSRGKWRPLRALGWLVMLCVLIVILYNAVARVALWLMAWGGGVQLASTSAAPAAYKLVAAVIGSIALLIGYRAAVRLGERRKVAELDLRRAPADLLLGLAVGGALMTAIVGALWGSGWVTIEPRTTDHVALALRDSIRSGVLEELVLRLVIFRLLWRAVGIWPALTGAALLFGALHLVNPDSSLFAAGCLIAGEGIGIGLYLITGRIWASIGMHAGWNFAQGWIFGAAVSGTTEIAGGPLVLTPVQGVSDALSGGGFGPEASLAALGISLLASAAFLFRAWALGCFVAVDE
jgi:membrane protease YdiL (CAAX protease family)